MGMLHTSEDSANSCKHLSESYVCVTFQSSNKVEVSSIGGARSP